MSKIKTPNPTKSVDGPFSSKKEKPVKIEAKRNQEVFDTETRSKNVENDNDHPEGNSALNDGLGSDNDVIFK